MRPTEYDNAPFHFFDDGMAQYSISSLLGDTIDTIKKAEFRQRTDSSAAKIKEIVSEIREDVTVMEQRRSRETTPTPKISKVPIPPDVKPDPMKQREQAMRNRELVRLHSPLLKYKALLDIEKKNKQKTKPIVRRKFSLVHALPDKPKKEQQHRYTTTTTSYAPNRLLPTQLLQFDPGMGQYPNVSSVPQYTTIPSSSLQYTTVSSSLPASPATPSAFSPILHH